MIRRICRTTLTAVVIATPGCASDDAPQHIDDTGSPAPSYQVADYVGECAEAPVGAESSRAVQISEGCGASAVLAEDAGFLVVRSQTELDAVVDAGCPYGDPTDLTVLDADFETEMIVLTARFGAPSYDRGRGMTWITDDTVVLRYDIVDEYGISGCGRADILRGATFANVVPIRDEVVNCVRDARDCPAELMP